MASIELPEDLAQVCDVGSMLPHKETRSARAGIGKGEPTATYLIKSISLSFNPQGRVRALWRDRALARRRARRAARAADEAPRGQAPAAHGRRLAHRLHPVSGLAVGGGCRFLTRERPAS